MISNAQPRSNRQIFRRVLALTLVTGTASLALTTTVAAAKPKEAAATAKVTLSPKFGPVYQAFAAKLIADKARPDILAAQAKVTAASDDASQKAAQAALGGLLTAEIAELPTVMAAAVTPEDHLLAGQLELNLGSIALNTQIQRQALKDIIASGKSDPADTGKFDAYLGGFAHDAGDYAEAITNFQAAIAAGNNDSQINVQLADSYLKNHQIDKGLAALQHAIDVQKASGQPVPVSWYSTGVVAAYNAKLLEPTLSFGQGLIQVEPSKQNWALLIEVVQRVQNYPSQDELDLVRLMGRTKSYSQRADYIDYIQAADARRFPGEVLDVIAAGEASGMLNASDPTIAEAKTIARGRATADRASLPGLFRDGRAPGATAATASAAGDAALSYGQAADALALYKIALDKPGVDTPRVLTRMGIAQIDTGDYTGAQATFAKITGPRQPLARLWTMYAVQKAAGK